MSAPLKGVTQPIFKYTADKNKIPEVSVAKEPPVDGDPEMFSTK